MCVCVWGGGVCKCVCGDICFVGVVRVLVLLICLYVCGMLCVVCVYVLFCV